MRRLLEKVLAIRDYLGFAFASITFFSLSVRLLARISGKNIVPTVYLNIFNQFCYLNCVNGIQINIKSNEIHNYKTN